jgi:hypothetical protein
VADALIGVAYADDAQVAEGHVRKLYHEVGGMPRIEVTVAAASGSPTPVRDLIQVATGALAHVYAGTCPDAVAGWDSRDEHCPACRVLMEAERRR